MLSKEAAPKKVQEIVERLKKNSLPAKELNTMERCFAKILLILSFSLFFKMTPIAFENYD